MRWASFRKAAHFGGGPPRRWAIYAVGCLSALLTVLLVADAGLVLDLVHSPYGDGPALESGRFAAWLGLPEPVRGGLGRYEYCLLALLAGLLLLVTAESLLLLVYFWLGERAAWDAVARLQIGVYEQVRRLGVPDWFEREGPQAEQQALANCLVVRDGLAAWWTTRAAQRSCRRAAVHLGGLRRLLSVAADDPAGAFRVAFVSASGSAADLAHRNARSQLSARQQAVLDAFRTARIVEGADGHPCQ